MSISSILSKTNQLIIQQHKEGKYSAKYNTFELKFHGLPFEIKKVELDNEEISLDDIKINGNSTMRINKDFTELHIIG